MWLPVMAPVAFAVAVDFAVGDVITVAGVLYGSQLLLWFPLLLVSFCC
jgi:hypothetical protein